MTTNIEQFVNYCIQILKGPEFPFQPELAVVIIEAIFYPHVLQLAKGLIFQLALYLLNGSSPERLTSLLLIMNFI